MGCDRKGAYGEVLLRRILRGSLLGWDYELRILLTRYLYIGQVHSLGPRFIVKLALTILYDYRQPNYRRSVSNACDFVFTSFTAQQRSTTHPRTTRTRDLFRSMNFRRLSRVLFRAVEPYCCRKRRRLQCDEEPHPHHVRWHRNYQPIIRS